MSEYTTQLRYICEQYAGRTTSANYKETPAVIAAARPKLFDFNYPLYDQSYKNALETKIINHYYFREIGAETAAQFKFMLARTLNEIMPFYNQLYKTADLEFNPFYDVDYYKEHKGTDQEARKKTETGSNKNHETETGNTSDVTEFSGTTQTETNGERTTTIDNDTTITANTTDTRTLNLEDETTFNTTDQKTLNTTDTKTLNTTDTKTLNTKDTVRNSDTPQGALTGIENNNYLSSASITDKTGTETIGRSGTETLGRTGTETGHKTGTETTERTGTDTLRKTGTDTTAIEETQNAVENSTSEQNAESTTSGSGTSYTIKDGTNTNSVSGEENISGTDQYLDHVYGKMGGATYAALLQEYRETLINIDMMVINDLEVCFMNIY